MSMTGWQVGSMKRVYWTKQQFIKNMRKVRHLGTDAHPVEGFDKLGRGTTVWGGEADGQSFAIVWEWAQVPGRGVALADPMYVLSNLMLVEDDGFVMEGGEKLVYLNSAVCCLRWQRAVMASLSYCDERMAA